MEKKLVLVLDDLVFTLKYGIWAPSGSLILKLDSRFTLSHYCEHVAAGVEAEKRLKGRVVFLTQPLGLV